MIDYKQTTFYLRIKNCDGVYLYYDSFIAHAVCKFCHVPSDNVFYVEADDKDFIKHPVFSLKEENLNISTNDKIVNLQSCKFPQALSQSTKIRYSGLTCVLRLMVLFSGDLTLIQLLGTSKKCFKACSEVSKWTALCEKMLPNIVKNLFTTLNNESQQIDEDFVENLLNTDGEKFKNNYLKELLLLMVDLEEYINRTVESNEKVKKVAPYIEGKTFQLNDFVLFLNFCLVFNYEKFTKFLPISCFPYFDKWFCRVSKNVCSDEFIKEKFKFLNDSTKIFQSPKNDLKLCFSDSPRTNFLLTSTSLSNESDKLNLNIDIILDKISAKLNAININTHSFPHLITHSSTSHQQFFTIIQPLIPPKRRERKMHQLQNMLHFIKQLLHLPYYHHKNPHIVDFCAGSGYIGVLLTHLFPHCTTTMVENKEESIMRCSELLSELPFHPTIDNDNISEEKSINLINNNNNEIDNNAFFGNHNDTINNTTASNNKPTLPTQHPTPPRFTLIKCNLNNFTGTFDIAVCLHGCGLVTDLVLQKCYAARAMFVSCPCCYGAIKANNNFTYPRSSFFKTILSLKEYLSIAQAGDTPQRQDSNSDAYTQTDTNSKECLSKKCMNIIDTDRLLEAEEHGYVTFLTTMHPPTSSPKNNILVALPKEYLM